MPDIENEIRDIIATVLEKDPSAIGAQTKFVEELGMDSMMALEIMAAIEKKYKIHIPEEKLMQFTNLAQTAAIAKEYLANKEGASA